MCNLSQGVEDRGIEKGIEQSIRNLMETMNLSLEQSMAALKVPQSHQEMYRERILQSPAK